MNCLTKYEKLITLLSIPVDLRTDSQVKDIASFFNGMICFKTFRDKEQKFSLFRNMQIEFFKKKEEITDFYNTEQNFYYIFLGEVNVFKTVKKRIKIGNKSTFLFSKKIEFIKKLFPGQILNEEIPSQRDLLLKTTINSIIIYINKENYFNFIAIQRKKRLGKLVDLLTSGIKIEISLSRASQFVCKTKILHFKKNDQLFKQGKMFTHLYLIVKGKIKVE